MKSNTFIVIMIIFGLLLILMGIISTASIKTKKVMDKCYDNHNNEIKGITCIKEVPLNNYYKGLSFFSPISLMEIGRAHV